MISGIPTGAVTTSAVRMPPAIVPTTIALTSVLGYVYAVGELYAIAGYIPMALPTATAFVALGVAILCAPGHAWDPRRSYARWCFRSRSRRPRSRAVAS